MKPYAIEPICYYRLFVALWAEWTNIPTTINSDEAFDDLRRICKGRREYLAKSIKEVLELLIADVYKQTEMLA